MTRYQYLFSLTFIFLLTFSAISENMHDSMLYSELMENTGDSYRKVMNTIITTEQNTNHLQSIIQQETPNNSKALHARILLAHIQHPAVFDEFISELKKWHLDPSNSVGVRPGLMSGMLLRFAELGPESRYIEKRVGWECHDLKGEAGNILTMRKPHYERIEKFTNVEVQAGIARNAAARQAILEYFLKFLDEASAYEQSEMVDLVHRLWGSTSSRLRKDELVADNLIDAVFRDESRPVAVRMRAAFYLPENRQDEVQEFMLNVVTNIPAVDSCYLDENMVNGALAYLEFSADTNTLAVLKGQTNAPAWKLKKIEKSIHAIELRLSKPTPNPKNL